MTAEQGWQDPFEILRRKWHELPTVGGGRRSTIELLGLPNAELLDLWLHYRQQATTGALYHSRGWYHDMYKRAFGGRRVADVGSGFGYEGVTFAQEGATVTFVDVAESNLEVVRRVCQLLQLGERTSFVHLKDLNSLAELGPEYDVMWCNGSLHHAPFHIARAEAQELLRHLRSGGRWIQLAYPRSRWEREGSLRFSEWGRMTDGEATPWAEWYDLAKVLALLEPHEFDVVTAFEFHSGDFIWFDLRNVSPARPSGGEAPASYTRAAREIGRLEQLVAESRKENEALCEQVSGATVAYTSAAREIARLEKVVAETRKENEVLYEQVSGAVACYARAASDTASLQEVVAKTWKEAEWLRQRVGELETQSSKIRKENEELHEWGRGLEVRIEQLKGRVTELSAQAELHRERLVALCKSRWRKVGMRLGIAMRPYWEDEYRTPP